MPPEIIGSSVCSDLLMKMIQVVFERFKDLCAHSPEVQVRSKRGKSRATHEPVRQSQIAAMNKSQSGCRLPGHSLGIADSGSSSGDLEKE